MKRFVIWFADRVSHYPVLFFGAVSATIAWQWRGMDTVAELMVTAWVTFLQTIFTASRKGLEEAKTAARDEALSDVASLAGMDLQAPPPIQLPDQPGQVVVEDTNPI